MAGGLDGFHVNNKAITKTTKIKNPNTIDGLVQDCSNSSTLAMELMQSCIKPSKYAWAVPDDSSVKFQRVSMYIMTESRVIEKR